ncbi:MAG: NYN domain-containing protein [Candidatus Heimdallarchaeota archaeon]|nr:NYN domain-containing protein [Candidatus Heimdallarchaeota archaeon]MCK5048115.1 NYN domain-containing protein [Candidatus Heimdallarchaeota archaeon]
MNLEKDDQSPTLSSRWTTLKSLFKREKKIVIFVDGPNILRTVKGHRVKLEDINEVANFLGAIVEKKVFLDQKASNGLMDAVVNSGYTPIVSTGDLYVTMGIHAMEQYHKGTTDLTLICSRDARISPIIMKLKEKGKEVAVAGFDPGFSVAIKGLADHVFELNID